MDDFKSRAIMAAGPSAERGALVGGFLHGSMVRVRMACFLIPLGMFKNSHPSFDLVRRVYEPWKCCDAGAWKWKTPKAGGRAKIKKNKDPERAENLEKVNKLILTGEGDFVTFPLLTSTRGKAGSGKVLQAVISRLKKIFLGSACRVEFCAPARLRR